MEVKTCSKCKRKLKILKFYKGNNKDGLRSHCIDCLREHGKKYNAKPEIKKKRRKYWKKYLAKPENKNYRRQYFEKNRKKFLKQKKIYYKKNCKEITAKIKIYRIENKDKISEKGKVYYGKNKDRIKKYQKTNDIRDSDCYSNRCYGVFRSELSKWQNHRCAICRIKENGRKLCVDHNHKTNQVGMLLCHQCNSGINCADDIIITAAYLEYLKTYHA